MAPRAGDDVPLAVTRKFPTNRDKSNISIDDWLQGREADDGAEGLWRIYDNLYDLTTFITSHPGGRDWIQLTRVGRSVYCTSNAEHVIKPMALMKSRQSEKGFGTVFRTS